MNFFFFFQKVHKVHKKVFFQKINTSIFAHYLNARLFTFWKRLDKNRVILENAVLLHFTVQINILNVLTTYPDY